MQEDMLDESPILDSTNEIWGWLASTPGFDRNIKNPSVLTQLKKFSTASTEPFRFEFGNSVDTPNAEGSLDHTVWVEIYNTQDKKVGEFSCELSDNETGPMVSEESILYACLNQLGFVKKVQESTPEDAEFEPDSSLPEPVPDDEEAPMLKQAKILANRFRKIAGEYDHIELDDSYNPSGHGYNETGASADDIRAMHRQDRTNLNAVIADTKKKLQDAYNKHRVVANYVNQRQGWKSLLFKREPMPTNMTAEMHKIRDEFNQILHQAQETLSNPREQDAFYGAFFGFNLKQILTSDVLTSRTILAKTASVSQHIAALDKFIASGNKLPKSK